MLWTIDPPWLRHLLFWLLDIGRKLSDLGSHNNLPPVSTTSFPGSFGQFPRSSRAI
jgi:hypothetical protein